MRYGKALFARLSLHAEVRNYAVKIEEAELKLLLKVFYQQYHYKFFGHLMASLKRWISKVLTLSRLSEYFRSCCAIQRSFRSSWPTLRFRVRKMLSAPSYCQALCEQVVTDLKIYPLLNVLVAGCSAGEKLCSLWTFFREEGLENLTIFTLRV